MKNTREEPKETQVAELGENYAMTMSSTSGREKLSFALVGTSELGRIYEVEVGGYFWDRSVPLEAASMTRDFEVRLPQVLISEKGVSALRQHLAAWLDDRHCFECTITSQDSEQILSVKVGADARFISSQEKPVFELSYSRGASMSARWAFVVDQTCIREFLGIQ